MTNEEAKQRLEMFKPFLADDAWKECYERATEALEKQIQKKPDFTDDYYDVAVCPCCHQYEFECGTTTWQMAFCPNCGQAIDWSDDE